MRDPGVEAWLDGLRVVGERREVLREAAAVIDVQYSGWRSAGEWGEARAGAAAVVAGQTSVEELADQWREAAVACWQARAGLLGGLLASLDQEVGDVADRTGLPEYTVREMLAGRDLPAGFRPRMTDRLPTR